MGHKCFISFKTEDSEYKSHIQDSLGVDMIDKSLDEPIDSTDEDHIMRKIREDYLSTSTVTIHLIGARSAESLGAYEQRFIMRELQASFYNGDGNTRNGVLGVVLPDAQLGVFKGSITCSTCGKSHNRVDIGDSTVIKEFSYNYYIPCGRCAWAEDDRYCVLATWEDFYADPEKYIDMAYDKRSAPIAVKVKVRGGR